MTYLDPQACQRVEDAYAAGNPVSFDDVRKCEQWKRFIQLIRRVYLDRYIEIDTPGPKPGWRGRSEPDPIPWGLENQLYGEIILGLLQKPAAPEAGLFSNMDNSEVRLEVVYGLIKELEVALEGLNKEADSLSQQHSSSY